MNDYHKARKTCSKSNTNKVKLYYTLKIKAAKREEKKSSAY